MRQNARKINNLKGYTYWETFGFLNSHCFVTVGVLLISHVYSFIKAILTRNSKSYGCLNVLDLKFIDCLLSVNLYDGEFVILFSVILTTILQSNVCQEVCYK